MFDSAHLAAIEQEVRTCFIHEDAPEYLVVLEQGILALNAERGLLNLKHSKRWLELLRAVHSLKGGAALSQLHSLSQLAHRIEDLLQALNEQRVREPQTACQLLLRSVDEVRNLLARAAKGELPSDPSVVGRELEQLLTTDLVAAPDGPGAAVLSMTGGVDPVRIVLETDFSQCLSRAQASLATATAQQSRSILADLLREYQALAEILNLRWLDELVACIWEALAKQSSDLQTEQIRQLAQVACQNLAQARDEALAGHTPKISAQLWQLAAGGSSEPSETADPEAVLPLASPQGPTPVPASLPSDAPAVETTMRVPVRRLDRLADTVGELFIGYESLTLDQQRLQQTSRELKKRTRQFYRVREQIQTLYDQLLLPQASKLLALAPSGSARLADLSPDAELDPLELDRFTELHTVLQDFQELIARIEESAQDVDLLTQSAQDTTEQLRLQLDSLRGDLTQARMVPFTTLAERFQRPLWDLNQRYDKSVRLRINGGDTLIDRAVLDQLYDPLLHLIRNAFDHGIESAAERRAQQKPVAGQIALSASQRGTRVSISVTDDGRGIDLRRVQQRAQALGLLPSNATPNSSTKLLEVLFMPGFSTASQVGELSGRGVGLDVVKSQLVRLRGSVQVRTVKGRGTRFVLSVPLTLNILPLLLCQSQRDQGPPTLIAVPSINVLEIVDLPPDTQQAESLTWRDQSIPQIALTRLMPATNSPWHRRQTAYLKGATLTTIGVILSVEGKPVALRISQLLGEREMVLKPFDDLVSVPDYLPGCTILPSGEVVPVLDPNQLRGRLPKLNRPAATAESRPPSQPAALSRLPPPGRLETLYSPPPVELPNQEISILIADDSVAARRWLARSLEHLGYQVVQCRDGQDALDRLSKGLQCHLAICDVEMPRLDGFQLLQQIRQQPEFQSLPVAMLTSRSGDRYREQALRLGANAYFTKPLGTQTLIKSLESLLRPVRG